MDCTLECRGLRPDPTDLRLGTVGPATSHALRRRGLTVHLEAPSATGGSLAGAFLALHLEPANTPVLLPCARGGRPELGRALGRAGFPLTIVETHESRPLPGPPPPPGVAVLLFSPSAVRALGDRVSDPAGQAIWAIGPTTANAARRAGFPVVRVLPEPTPKALKELLVR
ncbi:MAG: uroporphyrinogen-III synthase [Planctomycetota bacterium]